MEIKLISGSKYKFMKFNNKLVIAYDENKEENCIASDYFDDLLWKHYKIWGKTFIDQQN